MTHSLKARLPRGFADRPAADLAATSRMLKAIRDTYELYGFEEIETPLIEYTDALGKFLPDQDRPNEGVFSFQDDDEQWLSLRYDLTAPLARHVAERLEAQSLTLPFRSYRAGWVFRNEKPGPGRFRQFMQFDADTIGSASPAADAEICMMMADTLERLGIPRGHYVVKVNNRKILDGVMEAIGLGGDENAGRRLTVLRAIDKLDRLGREGVADLLGPGRRDESGDVTKGAELDRSQIDAVLGALAQVPENVPGADELAAIAALVRAAGYGPDRIAMDPSVVRGLEYYTGPVFEAELTFPIVNDEGQTVRFGSVAGGGRYDGLVGRFRDTPVPATGFSIGVSRLLAALQHVQSPLVTGESRTGPVLVLVMDRDRIGDYQRMVSALRGAGIPAELYLGQAGMKAQMKYADRRGAPFAVIQGSQEKERGEVQIKDLLEGARRAEDGPGSNAEYRAARLAQAAVPEADLVTEITQRLAAQKIR
ncbi:MAG: histidine--tRNA ligase [Enterovirga sp.]|nr:histidine--tRNA ligase [Enterovirga sp.]MDB5590473.1 histidine--tRNA ligase [Enterovirga sp.]